MNIASPLFARATVLLLAITVVLIVVGGATRVYDAGMSCPDWPHCYGVWWPWPESRVIAAGHLEGYMVNGQHYAGWQVALEWGHRLLAGLVGVGMLGLVAWGARQPRRVWVPLAVASVLLGLQIVLGAITVKMNNLHVSVVVHLGNAMLFAGALLWLWWAAAVPVPAQRQRVPMAVRAVVLAMPLLVWVTMLIGGAVSSTHSGGVCGGLFSCAGQWMPSPKADVGQHIHMQHRLFAVLTFVASVVLLMLTKRRAPALKAAALQVHAMVLGQVVLGVLTLYSFANYAEWYFPLSIMHLGWGTLVWLSAVAVVLEMSTLSAQIPTKSSTKGKR